MARRSGLFLATAALALALSAPAFAAKIIVTSYDMPNGDGRASGGTFNYWDLNYTGAGSTNVDGAPLSGGLGDLTDGVVAGANWRNSENVAGTGPWVGWLSRHTPDPTIAFSFGGHPTVRTIRLHVDNHDEGGGVFAPAEILVDGVSRGFTPPAPDTIGWITLSDLKLKGNTHTIQLRQDTSHYGGGTYGWVFVSEIDFAGARVPEPSTWAMLIAGFGLAGAALRQRRRAPLPA